MSNVDLITRLRACAECEQQPLAHLLKEAADALSDQGSPADERELFDKWFDNYNLSVRMNGGMMNDAQMFDAWKARAAHPHELALPTPEQVMRVVMKFQWEDRKNGTGTTNWAANLGMTVVNYVASLNSSKVSKA